MWSRLDDYEKRLALVLIVIFTIFFAGLAWAQLNYLSAVAKINQEDAARKVTYEEDLKALQGGADQ